MLSFKMHVGNDGGGNSLEADVYSDRFELYRTYLLVDLYETTPYALPAGGISKFCNYSPSIWLKIFDNWVFFLFWT
mgnify:CR=1 FL=1